MNPILQTIFEWILYTLTFVLLSITALAISYYKSDFDVSFMLAALTVLSYVIAVQFKKFAAKR